jgi:hypothetical protein
MALCGPYLESNNQTLTFPDEDPGIFHFLVAYVYEGRYDPIKPIASVLSKPVPLSITMHFWFWGKEEALASLLDGVLYTPSILPLGHLRGGVFHCVRRLRERISGGSQMSDAGVTLHAG